MSRASDVVKKLEMAKVPAGPDVMKRLKIGDTVVTVTGEPIEEPHIGLNKGYIRLDKKSGHLEFNREGAIGGKENFTIYKSELKVFKDFVKKL